MSYVSREEFIVRRCLGRDVLHLGCIGETGAERSKRVEHALSLDSLHSRLSRVARRVIGVDIDTEAIRLLAGMGGGEFYVADVENLGAGDLFARLTFDVVVAGDVIEHLSNPGRMLDGLRPLLRSRGELIVTTPNAFGLPNYLRFLTGRFREGEDHVLSFSYHTLRNLLSRHGWGINQMHTGYERAASERYGAMPFALGRWLLERRPALGGTLVVVCQREGERQ